MIHVMKKLFDFIEKSKISFLSNKMQIIELVCIKR